MRKTFQTLLLNVSLSIIEFSNDSIVKISTKQVPNKLLEAIGIDPATVRRDFSYFGELGRRGFSYDVSKLMTFFAELLNDNATTKVVLVGVGNIGRALLHYRFQERNRMQLVMAFDTDDNELVGTQTEDNIPIYGFPRLRTRLPGKISKQPSLTVPSVKAQEVAELLVDAGIRRHPLLFPSQPQPSTPRGSPIRRPD